MQVAPGADWLSVKLRAPVWPHRLLSVHAGVIGPACPETRTAAPLPIPIVSATRSASRSHLRDTLDPLFIDPGTRAPHPRTAPAGRRIHYRRASRPHPNVARNMNHGSSLWS